MTLEQHFWWAVVQAGWTLQSGFWLWIGWSIRGEVEKRKKP